MDLFYVKITTPGKVVIYRGRPVRTPVDFVVNKIELDQLKVQLHRLGSKNYTIKEWNKIGSDLGFTKEDSKTLMGDPATEEESKEILDNLIKEATVKIPENGEELLNECLSEETIIEAPEEKPKEKPKETINPDEPIVEKPISILNKLLNEE